MSAVWFWERMASPHMAGLLEELALQGREVSYLYEHDLDDDRTRQGWAVPALVGVTKRRYSTESGVLDLVAAAPTASIHFCDGIRGNRLIQLAQAALQARGLRQWVTMEAVDDDGWIGGLKRLEYGRRLRSMHGYLEGILAMGERPVDWLLARGVPRRRVFPFAYFLPNGTGTAHGPADGDSRFRIAFVGQFIELKRLGLLIDALGRLVKQDFAMVVIGSGPLEGTLREQARRILRDRVEWIGRLPMQEVPSEMARADCLVLPSRHDGWGAVVSEAMMVGTPVICSDRCGAAAAVRASGVGKVFGSGDIDDLTASIAAALAAGKVDPSRRSALARWSSCLGAAAGARYFSSILQSVEECTAAPRPPWIEAGPVVQDLPAGWSQVPSSH